MNNLNTRIILINQYFRLFFKFYTPPISNLYIHQFSRQLVLGTGSDDQKFFYLVQDSFLTQRVLEPTRGEDVMDTVLSSQKEFVDNVKISEPLHGV